MPEIKPGGYPTSWLCDTSHASCPLLMQWTAPTTGIAVCQSAIAVVERRKSPLGYQPPNRSPLLDGRFAIRKPRFGSTIMNDLSGSRTAVPWPRMSFIGLTAGDGHEQIPAELRTIMKI